MSVMQQGRDYRCALKPVLSEAKKAELRELAKYSEGMTQQAKMLCDFVPCSRKLAPWLKKELGL